MASMNSKFSGWFNGWKKGLYDYKFLIILSIIFIVFSEWVCVRASIYVDKITTVPVPDLILDSIHVTDMSFLFAYGFMAVMTILALYTFIFKVERFHEVSFMFCLLVLARSAFITLTHLGIPHDAIMVGGVSNLYQAFNFRNDLFFSGHAAIPFLGFLIFRKEAIGIFFFIMTILLSITVLMMHLHYSIDVFSAFFITYGVYKFGEYIIASKGWNDIVDVKKA